MTRQVVRRTANFFIKKMYPFVFPVQRPGSAVCDPVAESQKAVCKMDVLKFYVRIRTGELHVGKIPKAFHTQAHQAISGILGNRLRDREHHYIHSVAVDIVLQVAEREDGHPVYIGNPLLREKTVKRRVYRKTGGREGEVLQQRVAQITHTDHNEVGGRCLRPKYVRFPNAVLPRYIHIPAARILQSS